MPFVLFAEHSFNFYKKPASDYFEIVLMSIVCVNFTQYGEWSRNYHMKNQNLNSVFCVKKIKL